PRAYVRYRSERDGPLPKVIHSVQSGFAAVHGCWRTGCTLWAYPGRNETRAATAMSVRIRLRMSLTYTMAALTMSTANEIAVEMAVSSIRFGVGVTREVGMDLADLGVRRVLVITDPVVRQLPPTQVVMESLEVNRVPAVLYDRVRVEPTDESFLDAIAFAKDGGYDAFVAVGGGSTIDTAKAVNLYTTYPPADFLDYVNPPIGKGVPVPGPLKPLMAIPTTAGTGSETTGVSIFDLKRMHAKTGIANRRLKPTLGYLDPENTRTMPPEVAASSRLDILSHAIESFTALPYSHRPLPARPLL